MSDSYTDAREGNDFFAQGNYVEAARNNRDDDWRRYAALGLIGKTEDGLAGLERFDTPEASFYRAVAYWIGGYDKDAILLLKKLDNAHARNLLELIRKPRIRVLAQMPWQRRGPQDLIGWIGLDEKFSVTNISFHPDDRPNLPLADVHDFYDKSAPPDFYVCQMVEWHPIPPNIQELPCPILGHSADYDLHIQAVHSWLRTFDELVVTDHTEWADVHRLVDSPVSTFPKAFGIVPTLVQVSMGTRPIDLLTSGSLLHPYFREKAGLIHQIIDMDEIHPLFIHGFVSDKDYFDVLSRAKLCLSHVRHAGATPTRALEALAMGCVAVVQKGCVLNIFVNEQSGLVEYEYERLCETVTKVLSNWPEYQRRAALGSQIIRNEFSLAPVASQYFRYMTVLAAKPRGERSLIGPGLLIQKRSVLKKGWLVGGTTVYRQFRKKNLVAWNKSPSKFKTPHTLIDMARELVLEYAATGTDRQEETRNETLEQALKLYKEALERFPRSLVVRFNMIRVLLHYGTPAQVAEGLDFAETTVSEPAESWNIDALEDIFPWDFFAEHFNYRSYLDAVTQAMADGHHSESLWALIRLIRASIHHYIGWISGSINHLFQAVSLDPDYPYYRLTCALRLINEEDASSTKRAVELLEDLARESILFREAHDALKCLHMSGRYPENQWQAAMRRFERAERVVLFVESRVDESAVVRQRESIDRRFSVRRNRQTNDTPFISVLLINSTGKRFRSTLQSLRAQSYPRSRYEIVYVWSGNPETDTLQEGIDVVIYAGPDGGRLEDEAVYLNQSLINSRGAVLAICEPVSHYHTDFVARIHSTFGLDDPLGPSRLLVRDDDVTAFLRIDALRIGGVDEAQPGGSGWTPLEDLCERLVQYRVKEVRGPSGKSEVDRIRSRLKSKHGTGFVRTTGTLLPLSENPEIAHLRASTKAIWLLFTKEFATRVGVKAFSPSIRLSAVYPRHYVLDLLYYRAKALTPATLKAFLRRLLRSLRKQRV